MFSLMLCSLNPNLSLHIPYITLGWVFALFSAGAYKVLSKADKSSSSLPHSGLLLFGQLILSFLPVMLFPSFLTPFKVFPSVLSLCSTLLFDDSSDFFFLPLHAVTLPMSNIFGLSSLISVPRYISFMILFLAFFMPSCLGLATSPLQIFLAFSQTKTPQS